MTELCWKAWVSQPYFIFSSSELSVLPNLDLLYLLIAFIFSLIGFSSIVNFFIFYEERRVDVTIIKSIASSNVYENPYKEQAILEDSINISSNNKKNNNKYGKIYEPLITDH